MSLPKWPGFCFDRDLGKTNRPRIQILDRIGDTTYTYYNDKLLKSNLSRNDYLPFDQNGIKGPSWVVYDKKVLCFDGYWLDDLMEEPGKNYICRNCKVFFYLEDDTLQVLEPRIRNSRLCQGTVVKRQKVFKPTPNHNVYYNVYDLNVGEVLQLCGKYIKLNSCDQFTYKFLRRLGIDIVHPTQPPLDPIESLKSDLLGSQKKGKGFYNRSGSLNNFLDHGKFILRFYCFWDNSEILSDPRSMTLHFYLENETTEILENLQPNCGRTSRIFLKRQKLPKYFVSSSLNFPEQSNDPFYLNVVKARTKHHKLIDSFSTNNNSNVYYRACDLSLGQYINVYGRKFLLYDCDEFTKEYYRKKFGLSDFQSIDINQYWPKDQIIEKFIAPYNGWGTEEDSLMNCLSLRPKEVIKSNKKYINNKRTIDDLLFLNFLFKIYNPETKYDQERRFVISYCIEDDTFMIKENIKGKQLVFVKRDRHIRPKDQWKNEFIQEYYESVDFFIGAKILIKGLLLIIFSSDDYSMTYMEKNCHRFIYSSIERVLTKLRNHLINSKSDLLQFFKNEDPTNSGFVNYKTMETFKMSFINDIFLQELITLA